MIWFERELFDRDILLKYFLVFQNDLIDFNDLCFSEVKDLNYYSKELLSKNN